MEYNIFNIPADEKELIGDSYIYGFPTNKGLKKLNNEINLLNLPDINGIDLGCGDGRVIDNFNKNIKNSNWSGIELSEYRVENSQYKNDNNLIIGDLLDLDYSDYNFIYLSNVCFTDELNSKIEYKIFNEFNGYLLTFNKIEYYKLYRRSNLIKNFPIETNWIKEHQIFIYSI